MSEYTDKQRIDWLAKHDVEVRNYHGSYRVNYVADTDYNLRDEIDRAMRNERVDQLNSRTDAQTDEQ